MFENTNGEIIAEVEEINSPTLQTEITSPPTKKTHKGKAIAIASIVLIVVLALSLLFIAHHMKLTESKRQVFEIENIEWYVSKEELKEQCKGVLINETDDSVVCKYKNFENLIYDVEIDYHFDDKFDSLTSVSLRIDEKDVKKTTKHFEMTELDSEHYYALYEDGHLLLSYGGSALSGWKLEISKEFQTIEKTDKNDEILQTVFSIEDIKWGLSEEEVRAKHKNVKIKYDETFGETKALGYTFERVKEIYGEKVDVIYYIEKNAIEGIYIVWENTPETLTDIFDYFKIEHSEKENEWYTSFNGIDVLVTVDEEISVMFFGNINSSNLLNLKEFDFNVSKETLMSGYYENQEPEITELSDAGFNRSVLSFRVDGVEDIVDKEATVRYYFDENDILEFVVVSVEYSDDTLERALEYYGIDYYNGETEIKTTHNGKSVKIITTPFGELSFILSNN